MRRADRKRDLMDCYEDRKKEFDKVVKYLRDNKDYAKSYHLNHIKTAISAGPTAKHKIRALFVNAIGAAGGNNLRRTGHACRKFFKYIERLPDKQYIDLHEFFSAFSTKSINSFTDLFKYLHGDFSNIGEKKAALFINEINLIQSCRDKKYKIFTKYKIDQNELLIPVDIVIVEVLNNILKITNNLKPGRDFRLINDFAKCVLGNEFMLIEDLWFWGYFNQEKNDGCRKIKFNEDKYYSDRYMYPSDELQNKLRLFSRLINEIAKS